MSDIVSNRIVSVERVFKTWEEGVVEYEQLIVTVESENRWGIKKVKKRVISLYPKRLLGHE